MKIETELCAFSLEACRAAARAGVTRVELCASPNEGGTTPSAALIRRARQIPHLQLSVMIRPRGGDFLYTDDEFDLMLDEVDFARECGADCVVAGMLTPDGRVDEERTARLVDRCGSMQFTFHRAFDMTRDTAEALESLVRAGCYRVLTSGGRNTALEGIENIQSLVEASAGRIAIMAGSGTQLIKPIRYEKNSCPYAAVRRSGLHGGKLHLVGHLGRQSATTRNRPRRFAPFRQPARAAQRDASR